MRSYRYGLDLLSQTSNAATAWYHLDGLGSVVDLTDASGASLAWSEYYPYGLLRQAGASPGAPAVQPFAFSGEQLDPTTRLYHLRARQYDPATGRFLTTDPLALPISDPYVASYVYVRDNPVRWIDPTGLFTAGFCLTAQLGLFDILFGGATLCLSGSTDLEIGLVGTLEGGGTTTPQATGGFGIHLSDAESLDDLAGPSSQLGGSVGLIGVGFGSEMAWGTGRCGQLVNQGFGTATVGPRGGPEGHVTVEHTVVINPVSALLGPKPCPKK